MKLDETNYTTTIASSLDSYLEKIHPSYFERTYTPHARKQSLVNLNKSECFDLIKRINESSLLILEVKVTDDNKTFRSYDHRQHEIYKILRKINIPVEYCYNLTDDYSELNNESVLKLSNTSEPVLVCDAQGKITNAKKHIDLKTLVDNMLNKSGQNGNAINALISKDLIKNLQDSNIQLLFFAYNANNNEINILNTKEFVEVYSVFSEAIKREAHVDFKHANLQDIEDFFITTKKNIGEIINMNTIQEFVNKNSKNEHVEKTNTFGLGM